MAEAAFSLEAMLGSGELKGHRSLREYGWEIKAEAERFYHELLLECSGGAEAKRWLADQGISVKTIETFGIGYAPVRPSRLLSNHLLEQGYSFRALSGASVMRHDDGVLCDRFSGGLIPTRDQQRHCFGFIESLSSFPCISKNWLQRTTCISARRYRRLVLPPPSWPHDFNKFDAVLIVESPSEVLALHSAGIPNAVYLVGLEPFALRTALALAKTIIYPWQAERNASRPLEAIMDHIGHEYQRVKFLALPGGNSLTELLQQQGPEAVRIAASGAEARQCGG